MQNLASLGPIARYKEISKVPPIKCNETCDRQGGANFDPGAIIWALSIEAHQIPLYAQFGKPRPYG